MALIYGSSIINERVNLLLNRVFLTKVIDKCHSYAWLQKSYGDWWAFNERSFIYCVRKTCTRCNKWTRLVSVKPEFSLFPLNFHRRTWKLERIFWQSGDEFTHNGKQELAAKSDTIAGWNGKSSAEGDLRPFCVVHQLREQPIFSKWSEKKPICIQQVRSYMSPKNIRTLMEYTPGINCRNLDLSDAQTRIKCGIEISSPIFAESHQNSNFFDPKLRRIGLGK